MRAAAPPHRGHAVSGRGNVSALMTVTRSGRRGKDLMTSGMWYRALLTSEQVADGHVEIARRLFADAMKDARQPAAACLFVTSHDTQPGVLGEDTEGETVVDADALFFSPESISVVPHLIAQYGAQPSEPPERSRSVLLVGVLQDWDLLPRSSH